MPRRLQHPARIIPIAFLCMIALGTVMLMLPIARKGQGDVRSQLLRVAAVAATIELVTAVVLTGRRSHRTRCSW